MSTVRTGSTAWAIVEYCAETPNIVFEDAANSVQGPHCAAPQPQTVNNYYFQNSSWEYDYDCDDGAFITQIFQGVLNMTIGLTGFAGTISFELSSSLLGNQFQQLEDRDLAFNYPNREFSFFYPVERK